MGFVEIVKARLDAVITNMNKPNLAEKANFFRLMAVSQKAGLWVRDSLKALREWEKSKWLLLIIDNMIESLTEWASLAESMEIPSCAHFFNSDEVELIRSTEITGNMVQTLEEIANNLESSQEVEAKVKKASMYPAMMLWFTAVAVVVLLILVFPSIIEMYWDPSELPWITKFMLKASDFLQAHWIKILIIVI